MTSGGDIILIKLPKLPLLSLTLMFVKDTPTSLKRVLATHWRDLIFSNPGGRSVAVNECFQNGLKRQVRGDQTGRPSILVHVSSAVERRKWPIHREKMQ